MKAVHPPRSLQKIQSVAQQAYVALMMDIVGRSLAAASRVDPNIQQEIRGFPTGFVLQMTVFPSGPSFSAQVQPDGTLQLLKHLAGKADLIIKFKHLSHAFLVFSFQEGTARAFANDRIVADGDVSHAIRMVRCLNQLEAVILPKLLAQLAVKQYPQQLGLVQKVNLAAKIYFNVAQTYLQKHHIQGN